MSVANFTPEERQRNIEVAKAKKEQRKQWALDNLKLDWEDEPHWRHLASAYSDKTINGKPYRLPTRYHPAASKHVVKFLKAYGLDREWYEEVTGWKNGNEEARKCPDMPAFAQIGFLLEAYDESVNHYG